MFAALRARAARANQIRAARGVSFDADRKLRRLHVRLSRATDPAERAPLLAQMAVQTAIQADVHREAFGPAPIPWEDGRDLADSLAHEAALFRLLNDVEDAAAYGGRRQLTGHYLEPYAGPVLDRMAAAADPAERGAMLDDLYDAVVDVVGGQAAEVIACLPAPGHERAVTLGQMLREIRAERRARRAARPRRPWWPRAVR